MKIIKITLITFALFFVSINAQNINKIDLAKTSTNKLFDFCKVNNFEKAADLIAYSGKDAERNLNSSFNFKVASEANTVKRISKKIKAFLDISDTYEFGKFEEKTEDNIKTYYLEVEFISGNQRLKTIFSLVEVKGKMLLSELN